MYVVDWVMDVDGGRGYMMEAQALVLRFKADCNGKSGVIQRQARLCKPAFEATLHTFAKRGEKARSDGCKVQSKDCSASPVAIELVRPRYAPLLPGNLVCC